MFFYVVIILLLLFVPLVIWLIIDHLKLKQEFQDLSKMNNRINQDLAGLCSAAVNIDNRILINDQQLKSLLEKVADYGNEEHSVQPYQRVIQKIRDGADEDELIREFDLSHAEAGLLIRLHGS